MAKKRVELRYKGVDRHGRIVYMDDRHFRPPFPCPQEVTSDGWTRDLDLVRERWVPPMRRTS